MFWIAVILSLVCGYLLGSVNISIIIGKIKDDDIRNHGSGNAGATNSLRTFGKKVAGLVLLGDFLKAVFAVLIGLLIGRLLGDSDFLVILCKYAAGFGSVLGHNFPLYFGFRGGKGIITSVAFILMIDPIASAVILISGIIVIIFTKYVSLGSIVGAGVLPIYAILSNLGNGEPHVPYYMVLTIVMAFLAIYRHKENIKRLISGNESKLGQKNRYK